MDVNHFTYFATIVECDCNLSKAAKKLHISQSALSKILSTVEQEEGVLFFYRQNGRLKKLTEVGEIFFQACQDITSIYSDAMRQIRYTSSSTNGKVRVGIPPLILTTSFSSCLSDFRSAYPEIELEIIEAGAEDLKSRFQSDEMDFAVVLAPFALKTASAHVLAKDELAAFLSTSHSLANLSTLTWQQLDKQPLAIFNKTFSIHRLLTERFKKEKITPNIVLKSGSWDFLLESALSSDLITILPVPIRDYIHTDEYVIIPIQEAIPWEVVFIEQETSVPLTPAQSIFKNFILETAVQLS